MLGKKQEQAHPHVLQPRSSQLSCPFTFSPAGAGEAPLACLQHCSYSIPFQAGLSHSPNEEGRG